MDVVYKVVSVIDDEIRMSAIAPRSHYAIQYKLGHKSNGMYESPLFAFENMDYAWWFSRRITMYKTEILECEYEKYISPILMRRRFNNGELAIYNAALLTYYHVWRFWNDSGMCPDISLLQKIPPGTILCSWLKPIRVV